MRIPAKCLDCDFGSFELLVRDYEHERPDGSRVIVPRVNFLRCLECGEELMTTESNGYVVGFGSGA
jgi:hypothetical protein